MKNLIMLLLSIIVIGCGNDPKKQEPLEAKEAHEHPATAADTSSAPKTLSPHTSTMAMINDAHIHVDYSSPSVRDRVIFGGLVGYNTVWQAGAHKATWIETNKDLMIEGKKLSAGKYGFFVIPGKEEWKVMFNTRWDQHGKDDFNEAENALSLAVIPEELENIQESLVYEITETTQKSGILILKWEKIKIEVPFEVL
ncbi:MAG: DUF2911 domain-containing protein [Gillisia sp.]